MHESPETHGVGEDRSVKDVELQLEQAGWLANQFLLDN